MSNPDSSSNTFRELPPPQEGTRPTGGVIPPTPMGSSTYAPATPVPDRTCCFFLCSDDSNNACQADALPLMDCMSAAGSGCGARGAGVVRYGTAECPVCATMLCFERWRRNTSSQ